MQINSLKLKELHPCDIKLSNELIIDPTIDILFANIPTGMETKETDPPPSTNLVEDKDGTVLVIPEDMVGKVNIGALQKVKIAAMFATTNVNMIQVSDSESDQPQQRGNPLFGYLAYRFRNQGDNTHDHLFRFYEQLHQMEVIHWRFEPGDSITPRNWLFDQFCEAYPGRPCAQLFQYHKRMRVMNQILEQHSDSNEASANTSESSSIHLPSSSSELLYPPSDLSNSASTTEASTGSSSRLNQDATTIDDWWRLIYTREQLAAMDAEAEHEDLSINAITTNKLHEVI